MKNPQKNSFFRIFHVLLQQNNYSFINFNTNENEKISGRLA